MKSLELSKRRNLKLNRELLEESMKLIKKRDNERIKEMIEVALNEVDDLEFLPKEEELE